MASNKLARTNDDIQFVLSSLLRNVKDPRISGKMISVTRVETTGDLRYSKIWLSVMGLEDEKDFKRLHLMEIVNFKMSNFYANLVNDRNWAF